jgi:hypothetical protein
MYTSLSEGIPSDELVCTPVCQEETPGELVYIPSHQEEPLPTRGYLSQLVRRNPSRRAGYPLVGSNPSRREDLSQIVRRNPSQQAGYPLVGRNPSRREGIHPSLSGRIPPGKLVHNPARREGFLLAVWPLLAPGIPWDTWISARISGGMGHPQRIIPDHLYPPLLGVCCLAGATCKASL